MSSTERLNAALDGRYKIERQLGQGGMATVYLAKDLKHDRMVAVKVLKPELAAVLGAERFVVEIKTTAALQHPHILPLFDSGTADGFLYYVMPYIEGETLRGKLNRETQFSVDEAVRITTQVADALDYAHRHGVIHRDIKPENILLHDGRPMVADFGIALAVSAAAGGRMTETGLSLGTPHYMSPEQATAEKEITGRSDIYSLASVMYEMLAGAPPHMGASAQQIIMKIITEHAAPVTNLRKAVPPNVAAALEKALQKLPADRFETAKAFGEALMNRTFTSATFAGTPVSGLRSSVSSLPFAVVASVAVLAIVAAMFGWLRPSPQSTGPSARFVVSAPPAMALNSRGGNPDIAISPDGKLVVYVAGTTRALYVRPIDQLSGTLLAGTEGAGAPVFSPDGKWIAFVSGGVKKVLASGGPVVSLATIGLALGLSWGANDTIVASTYVSLTAIPAQGGPSVALTDTSALWWFPEVLPGGGVIYTGRADDGALHLAVLDRRTGKGRLLAQGGSYPRWVSTGHVVYNAGGALWALPFDPERMEATGSPVLVMPDIAAKSTGAANFAIARDAGTLVYSTGQGAAHSVVWIDTLGRVSPLEGLQPGVYRDPRFSPDGSTLALVSGSHLFTYDIRRSTPSQLTREHNNNYAPVWTPDSRNLVYHSIRSGVRSIYMRAADGSGSDQELLKSRANLIDFRPTAITRDGSTLLVTRVPPTIGCWVSLVKMRGATDTDSADFARNSVCNDFATLSPDGRWVAYNAATVVMVERFPEGGMRQQLSVGEGRLPLWSRDGRTAYYQAGDSMMAVSVQTGATLSFSKPRLLFRANFLPPGTGRHNVDIGPNGRFAAVVQSVSIRGSADGDASSVLAGSVMLVQDWVSELKRIMARK